MIISCVFYKADAAMVSFEFLFSAKSDYPSNSCCTSTGFIQCLQHHWVLNVGHQISGLPVPTVKARLCLFVQFSILIILFIMN